MPKVVDDDCMQQPTLSVPPSVPLRSAFLTFGKDCAKKESDFEFISHAIPCFLTVGGAAAGGPEREAGGRVAGRPGAGAAGGSPQGRPAAETADATGDHAESCGPAEGEHP